VKYRLSVDLEDVEFLFSLRLTDRRRVMKYLERLRNFPFTEGQTKVLDSTGRDVEVSIVSSFRILHWADHAVNTVRVVAIELNV
jgi:hypothetical protein